MSTESVSLLARWRVRDLTLRRFVDLRRGEQHGRLHRCQTRRRYGQAERGSSNVVGQLDHHDGIVATKREMEAVHLAAEALNRLADRLGSRGAAALQDTLDAVG